MIIKDDTLRQVLLINGVVREIAEGIICPVVFYGMRFSLPADPEKKPVRPENIAWREASATF